MNDRQYYSLEALLRSPKNGKGWFAYHEVKAEEAQRIEEMTGLSVLGYIHTIDRDGIIHILKGHGEARREDEIPVTEKDILSIPQWIKTFDQVRAGKNRNTLISILYTKKINGWVIILEEICTGRKQLKIKTMYKNKVVSEAPGI